MKNAESKFGIRPEKIFLVGDSAGGNLVSACTIMAINRGFRVPDGILMAYPALSLSKLRFTPSILLSVDDQLLPYPFLKMCLDSYCGQFTQGDKNCDPSLQQYLSPGVAKDAVLARFPPTRIMIAQNDALRDESLQFSLRLAKLDVDVQLKEYSYMPHGFLNYNAPILGMREEANETIHQCA